MPTAVEESLEIRPQPGLQEAFLSSPADIVIGGGSAGSGKTYALLLEPLRHIQNKDFGAVIVRRTYPEITKTGGPWHDAGKLYPFAGGLAREHILEYRFPSGATISFSHMQHAKDRLSWKGAQIPLICFDQLEEFEEDQFWYLLSRNRSVRAGIRPYIRASCNPVPDDDETGGWLNRLISWWINEETGYPIEERSGVVRWFVRIGEELHWADEPDDFKKMLPEVEPENIRPKSLTFIPGTLEDNPILDHADPSYRANLMALPLVERERLLKGNWKIKATAGKIFNRAWFGILPEWPKDANGNPKPDVKEWIRYWDKAGTEGGGKRTAGVLMGQRTNGRFIIANVVKGQWSSLNREKEIKKTAQMDRQTYGEVEIWQEQEGGSGGKESAEATVRNLAGFTVRSERVTGDKVTRAGPLSAQAEAENVDLLLANWNEDFLTEAQNFDGVHGFSDQIDAASGAFNKLAGGPRPIKVRKLLWG